MISHQNGPNDSEHPILVILHFSQSFPTKVVQNDFEIPILIISHFSQSFLTKVVQTKFRMPIFDHFALFSIIFNQNGP